MVRQRIDRKLKFLRGEIDEKKIASLYRTLLRAGFSSEIIRRELKRATTEEIPDPEPQDDL
jgi:SOS response regulatory protein OraA/RecX